MGMLIVHQTRVCYGLEHVADIQVLLHGNVEHTKLCSHDRSRAQCQSKCNDAFTQRSAGRVLVGTQNR